MEKRSGAWFPPFMGIAEARSISTWFDDHALQTRWIGHASGAVISAGQKDLELLLVQRTAKVWLVDAVDVSGIGLDVREPALALLTLLKKHGIRRVYGAISAAPIRMFAGSMMFAAGLKMTNYATVKEAHAAYATDAALAVSQRP